MKVGIVIDNNYPIDREVRTRKIAKSIDKREDDVFIFCRNTQSDPAKGKLESELYEKQEQIEYANIIRFSWFKDTPLNFVLRPIPFNPFWILWLILVFREHNIEVTISANIRAGPVGIIASKILGIPSIVDLRENHVELAKRLPSKSTFDRISQHPIIVRSIELFLYEFADELWVVTNERRDIMPARTVNSGKVSVVGNTPLLSEVDKSLIAGENQEFKRPGTTLVYVGVINDFRGLDLILRAMAHPDVKEKRITFAIAGEGPHRESLEELVQKLDLEERVFFEGWIDAEQVPAFLSAGDIGVIPHEVNDFTNTTVPNKLFDMMLAELPILATEMKPVKTIIQETECGRVTDSKSIEETASLIIELASGGESDQMGQNGRDAIQTEYNWETESGTIYESLDRVTGET